MDRRVLNNYYSPPAMEMFLALANLCKGDILAAGPPRLLDDKITLVQQYENQPLDSGVSIVYRLSPDGSHVLVFDPEIAGEMYHLPDWSTAHLPDDLATSKLPMETLETSLIALLNGE